MKFSLALPREAMSIPVIRRVLGDALRGLGVSEDCVSDILLAASEACTNVVKHARQTVRYEVLASIDDEKCVLKVVEMGPESQGQKEPNGQNELDGPNGATGTTELDGLSRSPARFAEERFAEEQLASQGDQAAPAKADEAESGRGIKIMHAL